MNMQLAPCGQTCIPAPLSSSGTRHPWAGPPPSRRWGKAQLQHYTAAPRGFLMTAKIISIYFEWSNSLSFHVLDKPDSSQHTKNPKTTTLLNQQQLYAKLFKLFRKRIKILAMPSCWNTVWLFPVAQQKSIPTIHGCSSFPVPPGRCWVTFSPLWASPAPRPRPKAVPTELLHLCWRCWCSPHRALLLQQIKHSTSSSSSFPLHRWPFPCLENTAISPIWSFFLHTYTTAVLCSFPSIPPSQLLSYRLSPFGSHLFGVSFTIETTSEI